MGDPHTFLGLLIRILVLVELGVDGAELQVKPAFKLEFVDPSRHTLVAQRAIRLKVEMLHAGLQAQSAFLQLP